MAGLLRQLHAFIDGGVRGNAIEKVKLEGSHAESDRRPRDRVLDFGFGSGA